MRCRICGAELRDGDDRCPDCGQRAAGPIRPAFQATSERPAATVGIAPGEVLAGRYEIDDEIGNGLLARLYRARDKGTGNTVILRVIHAGLLVSRDEREATQRALRASLGIEGRHLCATIDVGEHGERLFAVEPAVDAVPLGRVLRHRRARGETFAPREVLPVVAQSAAALASLPPGRAHGSIDPSLVLVHADGLRLVGAQVAMSLPTEALARATRNANVSALAYLAPEVRAGTRPTPASDRYAVAAIACECLTGRPSLSVADDDDDDDETAAAKTQNGSGARLPQTLERALARCLEPIPEERSATLAELISELASTAGLGMPSMRDSPAAEPSSDEGARTSSPGPAPRRDESEPTRRVPMDPSFTGGAAERVPPRAGHVGSASRGSRRATSGTAPHSAISVDPSAPTREEPLPSEVVAGGAAAGDRAKRVPSPGDKREPAQPQKRADPDDARARAADDARPKPAARRPAGGASDGTAEIELDQFIDEPSPAPARAAAKGAAPAAASTRPTRDRRDSAGSIPSLGVARKSPSLPSLSVPLPSKAAAAAPAGATAQSLSASASRAIPMTTSGSIPIELVELDVQPGAGSHEDGSSTDADANVPSLLSAARRHASRPQMRAVPSEPPRPAVPVTTATGSHVVVPEGVIGIPRVRPPSGEHAFAESSEVLFDDSRKPRPQTRQGEPTRTEIYDRSAHDIGTSEPPRRRSRWIVWASVLLALVILAVGLVIYQQRRDYAERRREIEERMHGEQRRGPD